MLRKNIINDIVYPVNCGRGAPMGRDDIGNKPTDQRVYSRYVPMTDYNNYDRGGAYWGSGARLRVEFTGDLSYVRFYREGE